MSLMVFVRLLKREEGKNYLRDRKEFNDWRNIRIKQPRDESGIK
jgi:hypothetical protein